MESVRACVCEFDFRLFASHFPLGCLRVPVSPCLCVISAIRNSQSDILDRQMDSQQREKREQVERRTLEFVAIGRAHSEVAIHD